MVNQQKVVQQETAYSAVVAPSLPISFFHVSMTPFESKRYRDGDTYDHSLQLHYRQFLVALLFADLHPYPPSFHVIIFTLVPQIVLR